MNNEIKLTTEMLLLIVRFVTFKYIIYFNLILKMLPPLDLYIQRKYTYRKEITKKEMNMKKIFRVNTIHKLPEELILGNLTREEETINLLNKKEKC